jgi:hypothetical protein
MKISSKHNYLPIAFQDQDNIKQLAAFTKLLDGVDSFAAKEAERWLCPVEKIF